jgi:hypothetical protein
LAPKPKAYTSAFFLLQAVQAFQNIGTRHPIQFFVLANNEIGTDFLLSSFPESMIHIDSDVYLISRSSSCGQHICSVDEVYSLKNRTFSHKVEINDEENLFNEILRKAPRRQNFEKVLIRGAAVVLNTHT